MTRDADVIVIGLGGMGSAATYHLARRGRSVLGFDRYPPGHANGSSHGRSRMIRDALDERYAPLVRRARELWADLEQESGRSLVRTNGQLTIAAKDDASLVRFAASATRFGVRHELLSAEAVNTRFPGFALPAELGALYEPDAGTLAPEECVAAHAELAAKHGADLRYEEPVVTWRAEDDGVVVETDSGNYTAARCVITPGPWAPELLRSLNVQFAVQRISNVHFQPDGLDEATVAALPNFAMNVAEGDFYVLTHEPPWGVKIGLHDRRETCSAETIRREVAQAEVDEYRNVLQRYVPGSAGDVLHALTCMYTDTPDLHFVIDALPGAPNVFVGCGCSGHAFKETSVLGEILADLAIDGRTEHRIDHLSAARFA